jgi:hypothetical protein
MYQIGKEKYFIGFMNGQFELKHVVNEFNDYEVLYHGTSDDCINFIQKLSLSKGYSYSIDLEIENKGIDISTYKKLYQLIEKCGSESCSSCSDGRLIQAWNMYININKDTRRRIKKFYYQVVLHRNEHGVYCIPVQIRRIVY